MSEKAEQQIMKAEMLLKRKEFDRAVESLEKAIQFANEHEKEDEDDDLYFAYLVQAHCFLGEAMFMKGEYAKAKEHLSFIEANHDEIEENWDDALNNEVQKSNYLLHLISRYHKA